jgi:hypothetical protein
VDDTRRARSANALPRKLRHKADGAWLHLLQPPDAPLAGSGDQRSGEPS